MDKNPKHGIIGIYLHGSRAEGTNRKGSDYDITIVTDDSGKLDIKREFLRDFKKPKKNIHNIIRSKEMVALYDPLGLITGFKENLKHKKPDRIEAMIKLSEQLKNIDMDKKSGREKLGREIEKSICMIMGVKNIEEAKKKYNKEYYKRHGKIKHFITRIFKLTPKTKFPCYK